MCLERFESYQALWFSCSLSNMPQVALYVFMLLEYMQWFFCSRLFNSFLNTANRAWCTLVSFSRWLNRGWQRKMEQLKRSVQLGLVQLPDLSDPAFVSLLQCQLSGSFLKIYVHAWCCTLLSLRVLSRLDTSGGVEGNATIFFLNSCLVETLPLTFNNTIRR